MSHQTDPYADLDERADAFEMADGEPRRVRRQPQRRKPREGRK